MPEQAQDGLDVKNMKLYAQANSILADLAALGFPGDAALSVEDLVRFDQLHYHGVESVQAGIDLLGINAAAEVLEVGAGWGGPSRFIASRTGARVVALELQEDFHTTGQTLTQRCGLDIFVNHQRGDFLSVDYGQAAFDHVVSWLALYHIPNRATYTRKIFDLLKPGGTVFVEDLMAGTAFADTDANVLGRELFANSMVSEAHYIDSLRAAGFEIIQAENMTADWRTFTTTRLEMFDANRQAFIGIHGPELFEARRHFYSKIVEYFTADAIGGMRVAARKP